MANGCSCGLLCGCSAPPLKLLLHPVIHGSTLPIGRMLRTSSNLSTEQKCPSSEYCSMSHAKFSATLQPPQIHNITSGFSTGTTEVALTNWLAGHKIPSRYIRSSSASTLWRAAYRSERDLRNSRLPIFFNWCELLNLSLDPFWLWMTLKFFKIFLCDEHPAFCWFKSSDIAAIEKIYHLGEISATL